MSTHTGGSAASKEPHWMGERDYARDLADDEYERRMQQQEDEQPRPSMGGKDLSGGDE